MVGRIIIILLVAALVVVAVEYYPRTQDGLQSGTSSISDICDSARPSIISIWTEHSGKPYNQGSGFIISKDGLILTNFHVIDKADTYTAGADYLKYNEFLKLEIVAYDKEYDIALMQIDGGGDWPPLPLKPGVVKQGDRVLAMGYPEEATEDDTVQLTITYGIVSRISNDENHNPLIIQTDAFITYGSSGGPLWDVDAGGVVGICTWAYHDDNDNRVPGINYAISIDKVMELFGEYLNSIK